jgi:hypothetical protein
MPSRIGAVVRAGDNRFETVHFILEAEFGNTDNLSILEISSRTAFQDIVSWIETTPIQHVILPLTLPRFYSLRIGEYSKLHQGRPISIPYLEAITLKACRGLNYLIFACPPSKHFGR